MIRMLLIMWGLVVTSKSNTLSFQVLITGCFHATVRAQAGAGKAAVESAYEKSKGLMDLARLSKAVNHTSGFAAGPAKESRGGCKKVIPLVFYARSYLFLFISLLI